VGQTVKVVIKSSSGYNFPDLKEMNIYPTDFMHFGCIQIKAAETDSKT
jgi:hypothetical protein